jgi:hypothetical protein
MLPCCMSSQSKSRDFNQHFLKTEGGEIIKIDCHFFMNFYLMNFSTHVMRIVRFDTVSLSNILHGTVVILEA